jgi:diguanylate cyclase (GGDEF)-like protein/PAS domain S-box-containing protein
VARILPGSTLLAALPDPTFLVDRDGLVLDVHMPPGMSPTPARGEPIGRYVTRLVSPDASGVLQKAIREVAEEGGARALDLRTKGDPTRIFDARLTRPEPARILLTLREVTETRHRDALAERSRTLLAAIPDLMVLVDRKGTIVEVHNGRVLSSRRRDRLIGQAFMEVVGPTAAVPAAEAIERVLSSGSPEALTFEHDAWGPKRIFEATLTPCEDDKVLCVAKEVTERRKAERKLRINEARFRRLLSSVQPIVHEIDREFRYVGVFGGLTAQLGHRETDHLGKLIREVFPAPLAELHEAQLRRAFAGEVVSYEWSVESAGETRWYSTELSPMRDGDGRIAGAVAVRHDITERHRADEARAEQVQLFEAILKAQSDVGEGVIVGEGATFAEWQRQTIYRNAAVSTLSGYSAEEIGSMPSLLPFLVSEERVVVAGRLQAKTAVGDRFETAMLRKDGRRVPIEVFWRRFKAGRRKGAVAIIRDNGERARAKEQLEHRAFFDALTDLPNRSLFQDRLAQALAVCRRSGASVGLLLLDLDRFKEINDTFGHAAGDGLLQEVAARFKVTFRETDTIARLGGDEFAFVLPGAHLQDASRAAQRILKALEPPALIEGRVVDVGASIGIAIYPEHGQDADVLLRCADVAMYTAKRQRLGLCAYEQQIDQHSAARLSMTAELRQGLEENQLLMHYQPQVEVKSGKVVGVEALVRWQHPRRELLGPAEFVPLAEETGLIRPLMTFTLEEALKQCRALSKLGWEVPVAVNLSMRNLIDPQLPEVIGRILMRTGVPPALLELELTESTVMADVQRAIEILGRLRAMGVRLTIDDFGTGHSALAYLQRLPLTAVKIDKSFVTHSREDDSSAAIVSSTIDLAHKLHFKVVAEGVEDKAVLDDLRRLGCDSAQGYYISKPLPFDDLVTWIDARSSAGEVTIPRGG